MRNLILIPIIFILLAACKKEEKEKPIITTLKGKWVTWDNGWNSDKPIKTTEVLEFGDNTYELVFNEKLFSLPDCTLVYKFKRIIKSDYSVDKRFIKFTNMRSDTNGVTEYRGKTEYLLHRFNRNELYLYSTDVWYQLSGTNGQIKDGLFYQLDSSRNQQQDTIKYHHYKMKFAGDFVDYCFLVSNTREMPDENADWDLKYYKTEFTDSTFACGSWAYYQFIDGKMISIVSHDETISQRSYISYAEYLSLLSGK
jgi:hypothetical protein